METEEERRATLENDAATKRLRLVMETEEERKARLVKMYHTAQVGPGSRGRKKCKKWNGYYLYFIWILFGIFKTFQGMCSLAL